MSAIEVVPVGQPVLATQSQLDLLKSTIASGLTDDEFRLFVAVCERTGLDPLTRQCYAVKRWSSREQRDLMTIQVSIDGYRALAHRTGRCAGIDDAVFTGTVDGKFPEAASVTVWRLVGGQRCPFTASARWVEYCPEERLAAMWRKMPAVMLGKVAEALALRKAFPAELAGTYTDVEMAQADVTIAPVEPVPAVEPEPEPPARDWIHHDTVAAIRAAIQDLPAVERSARVEWPRVLGTEILRVDDGGTMRAAIDETEGLAVLTELRALAEAPFPPAEPPQSTTTTTESPTRRAPGAHPVPGPTYEPDNDRSTP